jgi:hypothetical protein
VLLSCAAAYAAVFPTPHEIETLEGRFKLGPHARILVPSAASGEDLFLARFLAAELSQRYGVPLRTARVESLPARSPFILMRSLKNPLVAAHAAKHGLKTTAAEGYELQVDATSAVVAGTDDAGAFYGLQTLRQLITKDGIQSARVRDWPFKPFRGIKLYLPGRENIPYFKRFVRDFMALYKYNKLIVELNGAMRLDRRPEINAGWLNEAGYVTYFMGKRGNSDLQVQKQFASCNYLTPNGDGSG